MDNNFSARSLSVEAQHAWETIVGLPLATSEQQQHAWDVLHTELDADSYIDLQGYDAPCELYLSGQELAALRVIVAWLKASDRAGRMPNLPFYPELAEAIVGQLGEMPWPGVYEPEYLDRVVTGGNLWIHPHAEASALMQMLEVTLRQSDRICPGWPSADRTRLIALLCDVWYWLHTMLVVHDV